ncbi:DNA-binding response regulator, NarL/FixJ family, contains REC and HTH domains [Granulicella pectinivorans]|jgi:DNA-binding NarL/FixJ family response regulator|uniref:DNA-binding response regulator, NarL/FixJ family, contains REC and HTH domains n=1 Tax=Granulicella pectinivorans TaxID=474950 RepID=A0A1I6MCH9_9BACT|nr:response regulator transcription factor [Granulicella pectinivorans]SFS13361.1 DNA-binding response regulator, NarL/FixJ family, contains REC and HTH domains [Granulicella pectinivorans]
MNRIILADNQAIFRAGAARVLSLEDDMRIVAQCDDGAKLAAAVETFRGALVLFAQSLGLNAMAVLAQTKSCGSRAIMITENGAEIQEEVVRALDGMVTRAIAGVDLVDCVRKVGRGTRCVHGAKLTTLQAPDVVGARVRDRLTPKELQIVALIVQGCKNKEIAMQLGTKEQVIKNYLRSIYDKTGVSDRLELALFTIHHRILAEAAAKAGSLLARKSA